MKVTVLSLDGKKLKEIALPTVFETAVDEGLIKRAVLSMQSARIQPKGPNKKAGRNYTAEYIGARGKPNVHRTINIGRARLPRLKNRRYIISGDVANVSQAVHGPKAHPLKTEKGVKEKINKKEKRKAIAAAIAATANSELVKGRGHRFDDSLQLPLVVEKKVEELDRTKKVKEALTKLNVWQDIERAKKGRKRRAGKGKKRGRKYKKVKSLLIVVEKGDKLYKAARNIEGINISKVKELNAELLAPGTRAGRLTIWSEAAIKALEAG